MSDSEGPKGRPSSGRITIWVVVGAIGLYMVINGLVGALTGGG